MIGRWARTVLRLHPLQIALRPPRAVAARVIRGVPAAGGPRVRRSFAPAHEATRAFARAERARGEERLAHLTGRLRDYEAVYGLEAGDAADGVIAPAWRTRTAIEPYPAAVRARRLAVAARLGRPGLDGEIARACRAVAMQLELHLLGNHLLEDAIGLVAGGAACEGAEADAWLALGSAILAWQLPEQFLADGGHFERSASYHLLLTGGLLEAIELASAAGRRVPRAWTDTAERAVAWAARVRAPDGTYPLFNDAALDSAPSIDDVAALAESCNLHACTTHPSNGAAGAPRLTSLPDTGWVIVRAGDAWLALDAGPDGAAYQPGHVHADALTFELWIGGARAVVDYGVSSYATDAARDETRATRSHNTLEVAGADASEVWAAFRTGRSARARVVDAEAGGGAAFVVAKHDGYRALPGAPEVTRRIDLRPGRLAIADVARGGDHDVCSRVRVDAEALERAGAAGPLRVEAAPSPASRKGGVWYPRHARPRPAVVFEQRGRTGEALTWTLTW